MKILPRIGTHFMTARLHPITCTWSASNACILRFMLMRPHDAAPKTCDTYAPHFSNSSGKHFAEMLLKSIWDNFFCTHLLCYASRTKMLPACFPVDCSQAPHAKIADANRLARLLYERLEFCAICQLNVGWTTRIGVLHFDAVGWYLRSKHFDTQNRPFAAKLLGFGFMAAP